MNADLYYFINSDYYKTNLFCIEGIRRFYYGEYDSFLYVSSVLGFMGLYETILLRNLK